jgi:hypothetical protein
MIVSLRALVGKMNEAARNALMAQPGCACHVRIMTSSCSTTSELLDVNDCDFSLVIKHFKIDSRRMVFDLMVRWTS